MVSLENYNGLYFLLKDPQKTGVGKYIRDEYVTYMSEGQLIGMRRKGWKTDGKIYLIKAKGNDLLIPIGFYNSVVDKLSNASSYISTYEDNTNLSSEIPIDWIKYEIKKLPLTKNGKDIILFEHQERAVIDMINRRYGSYAIATSGGKTLITYTFLQIVKNVESGRVLIIVPRNNLMDQMYNDFIDYSSKDKNFNIDDVQLFSGRFKERCFDKKIIISTYQLLNNLIKNKDEDFIRELNSVKTLIVDEAHMTDTKSFDNIFKNITNTTYRIGMSGTFDLNADASKVKNKMNNEVNSLVIQGFIGETVPIVEAHELEKQNVVTPVYGRVIHLVPTAKFLGEYQKEHDRKLKLYKEEEKEHLAILQRMYENMIEDMDINDYQKISKYANKSGVINSEKILYAMEQKIISRKSYYQVKHIFDYKNSYKHQMQNKKFSYQNEIDMLHDSEERNDFIIAWAIKMAEERGNTLVVFKYIEGHGEKLLKKLNATLGNRDIDVFYIHGKSDDSSAKVKETVENSGRKSIILANIQMVAEGWSVDNIGVVIFACTNKAYQKFIQTIGRARRKSTGKDMSFVYVISDYISLDGKEPKNYSYLHAIENMNGFNAQKIPYEEKKIFLKSLDK